MMDDLIEAHDDDQDHPSSTDDEYCLPKATLSKLINDMLPRGAVCTREVKELIHSSALEFLHMVSSEANELAEKSGRKIILPEHITDALTNLGYGKYVEEVQRVQTEHEAEQKAKDKRHKASKQKLQESGLTQEELVAQQEELFKAARERMLAAKAGADLSSTTTNHPSSEFKE